MTASFRSRTEGEAIRFGSAGRADRSFALSARPWLKGGPGVRYSSLRGEVAQLVEHTAENRGVAGSIPALATSAFVADHSPLGTSGEHDEAGSVGPGQEKREEQAVSGRRSLPREREPGEHGEEKPVAHLRPEPDRNL